MDISERIINDLRKKGLPEHIKNMIIDDAMPMDIDTRIMALLYMALDEDKNIAENSRSTLSILDQELIINFIKTQSLDNTIFKSIIISLGKFEKAITSAITHKDFKEETAMDILSDEGTPVSILELFSINQTMFYKYPVLIDILFNNNKITKEIADRLVRYREGIIAEARLKKGFVKGESNYKLSNEYEIIDEKEEIESEVKDVDIEEEEKIVKDLAIIEEIYEEDQIFSAISQKEEKPKEEKPKKKLSILKLVNTLSVSGQIKLAIKGNKEARSILIRSPKKMVAQAVLQNPKINENEIEFYAKLRNISEDILRIIARNPEWVKKPSIMKGLLYNPKTPASIAMSFLSRVSKKEIKDISKSKSLPQALRTAAKRKVMQEQAKEEKLKKAMKK